MNRARRYLIWATGFVFAVALTLAVSRAADAPLPPLPVPWECKVCPTGQVQR